MFEIIPGIFEKDWKEIDNHQGEFFLLHELLAQKTKDHSERSHLLEELKETRQ